MALPAIRSIRSKAIAPWLADKTRERLILPYRRLRLRSANFCNLQSLEQISRFLISSYFLINQNSFPRQVGLVC